MFKSTSPVSDALLREAKAGSPSALERLARLSSNARIFDEKVIPIILHHLARPTPETPPCLCADDLDSFRIILHCFNGLVSGINAAPSAHQITSQITSIWLQGLGDWLKFLVFEVIESEELCLLDFDLQEKLYAACVHFIRAFATRATELDRQQVMDLISIGLLPGFLASVTSAWLYAARCDHAMAAALPILALGTHSIPHRAEPCDAFDRFPDAFRVSVHNVRRSVDLLMKKAYSPELLEKSLMMLSMLVKWSTLTVCDCPPGTPNCDTLTPLRLHALRRGLLQHRLIDVLLHVLNRLGNYGHVSQLPGSGHRLGIYFACTLDMFGYAFEAEGPTLTAYSAKRGLIQLCYRAWANIRRVTLTNPGHNTCFKEICGTFSAPYAHVLRLIILHSTSFKVTRAAGKWLKQIEGLSMASLAVDESESQSDPHILWMVLRHTLQERLKYKSTFKMRPLRLCGDPQCSVALPLREFKRCDRCFDMLYCSPKCQKAHWRVHKESCASRGLIARIPLSSQRLEYDFSRWIVYKEFQEHQDERVHKLVEEALAQHREGAIIVQLAYNRTELKLSHQSPVNDGLLVPRPVIIPASEFLEKENVDECDALVKAYIQKSEEEGTPSGSRVLLYGKFSDPIEKVSAVLQWG